MPLKLILQAKVLLPLQAITTMGFGLMEGIPEFLPLTERSRLQALVVQARATTMVLR